MNKTFRMTPDVVPYYGAVLVYGTLLVMLLLMLQAIYVSQNARAVADERGVSIDRTGFYNATVAYADIKDVGMVPVDRESAYLSARKEERDGCPGWSCGMGTVGERANLLELGRSESCRRYVH